VKRNTQRGQAATKQVYDKNNFPTDRNPGLLRALAGQATQRMKSKSIRQNNFGQNN
jgi:hypothetical protein